MIRKIPNTWYVSIYVPQQEKTGYYYSRHSRTFASESEAKQFAAAKIAAGVEVTAGTLNPSCQNESLGHPKLKHGFQRSRLSPRLERARAFDGGRAGARKIVIALP